MSHPLILVVEDNPDEAQLVCEAFGEVAQGVSVGVAITAAEALERLAALEAGDWPRLLVTDRNLPDLNGEELIQRIRANPQAKALTLVMLSGGIEPPAGLSDVEWYEKPTTWSQWRTWASRLVTRHLSTDR
jgi:CheY-like chemotaxis protein